MVLLDCKIVHRNLCVFKNKPSYNATILKSFGNLNDISVQTRNF